MGNIIKSVPKKDLKLTRVLKVEEFEQARAISISTEVSFLQQNRFYYLKQIRSPR